MLCDPTHSKLNRTNFRSHVCCYGNANTCVSCRINLSTFCFSNSDPTLKAEHRKALEKYLYRHLPIETVAISYSLINDELSAEPGKRQTFKMFPSSAFVLNESLFIRNSLELRKLCSARNSSENKTEQVRVQLSSREK